jgi:hypothetical protein
MSFYQEIRGDVVKAAGYLKKAFIAQTAAFMKFRIAFVISLVPAALVLMIALLLPANSPQPWLATVLAISLWCPLFVTLLMSLGLVNLFISGDPLDSRALGSWATLLAGSLALVLAARMLPVGNWNLNFILLLALGLLAFGGGLAAMRRWIFLAVGLEVIVLLVPVVFPTFSWGIGSAVRKADEKLAQSIARPLVINPAKPPPFWSPATGNPLIWYTRTTNGGYVLFSNPGYDPNTGLRLKPVTTAARRSAILNYLRAQSHEQAMQQEITQLRRQTVQPAANLPQAAQKLILADPEPLHITSYHQAMTMDLTPPGGLWYTVDSGGTYRFFSSYGLDPVTKTPDKLITATIADKIRKYFERYYWPKEPDHIAIRSEKQALNVNFFPPGGLWYDHGGTFGYRLFDGPGTDPQTGEPLTRVTPEIAKRLRATFRHAIWPAQ